jgi:methionyl-tRNA synthetase
METFFQSNIWLLILVMIWVLPWKGYALWNAAKLSHKWWFIILLVVNTVGILDIIYIFFVAKKASKKTDQQMS